MFLNVSTYLFAPLTDLKELRLKLLKQCQSLNLKGTILLSTEGINMFVAGLQTHVETLIADLRRIPGLENLAPKLSESDHQPFSRMLVRIKKEIIAFGVPGIEPGRRTSPKLPPQELKKWLDEGRPITLLDTRNDYEVKLGTFKHAVALDIKTFRDFPAAVAQLPEELKEQPIVMFCTGGIRCEKAGPFMESQGFRNILQLDGGILKYFEECGSGHYDGECFVFDKRAGVDPALNETTSVICYACLAPLNVEDQSDQRYQIGVSCPYCFKTSEQQMQLKLTERHQALCAVTAPLPGKEAYANARPLNVPAKFDQVTVVDFLSGILTHMGPEVWQRECELGNVVDAERLPVESRRIVRAGERYMHLTPCQGEPDVDASVRILYEDGAIVVINKPAPLPIHPCGRFNRNTLTYILGKVYAPECPRPAHRLDANTTGVMVLARSKHFAGIIQPQFANDQVHKSYVARVQGQPTVDFFVCDARIGDEKTQAGGRAIDPHGLESRTEVSVLQRFSDGTALLRVVPKTGRTNQIRVHLWDQGFPICGDQLYLKDRKLGQVQTHEVGEAPLCLHAHEITFKHPTTRQAVTFTAELPAWAHSLS